VKKIFSLIIKKDQLNKWMQDIKEGKTLQVEFSEEEGQKVYDYKRIIERLISSVHAFRHEHKIFKGQFIFKGRDFQELCAEQYEEVQDFIKRFNIEEFGMRNDARDLASGIVISPFEGSIAGLGVSSEAA